MTSPAQYPPDIYNALYTDETGKVVGLDEVQLLEPVPVNRVPELMAQLFSDDLYLAYQCGLVLAAWGVEEGVNYLRSLIDSRIDKIAEFEPHRLWGEDNLYDVISEALGVAILSDYDRSEIVDILRDTLQLYGECYFESKLKGVLIRLDEDSLLPDIKRAMQLALGNQRYYQASQLLPVLAKYDNAYALTQVSMFQNLIQKDDRIRYNLGEMQAYL
ncbi:hypothetical protein MTX78_01115 [Hymenobacter tibetensis]|uniref:Uncharacterized protein n=1 Tax=Hymenobacter tibetensis TaxID=497967 RepID=A0ABY4CYW8_9BACT|nr:hypothetical protein [Hymenobacter tibetensis]UOG75212.1 hypothetical protein MTX78_01115 [Hymenobacter tibetensis]